MQDLDGTAAIGDQHATNVSFNSTKLEEKYSPILLQ